MSGQNSTNRNIEITLLSFDKTISLDTGGILFNEIYNPIFDTYDAISTVNVDLKTFSNMFCFQTDYIDVNDITETDIKYYVFTNKTNLFIPNLGSSIVNTNPIVEFTPSLTIESNQLIGKDFARYLAYLLFNTPYGTDLFVNESEIVNSVSSALDTAWSYCLADLKNVSNESTNQDIPLVGNSPAKYLTNDYSSVQNICREIFLQLISKAPSRFTNLPQIPVEDENAAPIREDNANNLKYYYLPFESNDIIQLRVNVRPNNNQPTFGINSITAPTKFETVGNDIQLKGRTYIINMVLTDNLSATTRLTGKCSIKVVGKSSTLSTLDYLPIIQKDNIINITINTTQINSNTIQCDIFYEVDATVISTSSILDVGFGFSSNAVTYYNANIQSIEIMQFGGIPLYGKGSQFKGLLSDIIFSATDVPSVSPNTSLAYAFSSISNFNKNVMFLNNWNLLNVSGMEAMFDGCSIFNNGSLTDDGLNPLTFNTSSTLTRLTSFLRGCAKFNQTVSISNITGVTSMGYMFSSCSIFNNGSITNDGLHELSFVTSSSLGGLSGMFQSCSKFNQTISISNMIGITTLNYTFSGCSIFNNGSIINDELHALSFVTSSSLTNIVGAFSSCSKLNQAIYISDTSGVTVMNSAFSGCSILNKAVVLGDQTPDGSGNVWQINVPKVTTMASAFASCLVFNNGETTNTGSIPLKIRTGSSLTHLTLLFSNDAKFNQPVVISNAQGSVNISINSIFNNCSIFNQAVSMTNTNYVNDMSAAFQNCAVFNKAVVLGDQTPDGSGNVWQINVPRVTTMAAAFKGCTLFNNGETTNTGIKPLRIRTTSSLINFASVFETCAKFNQAVIIQDITKVTTFALAFSGCNLFNNGGVPLNLSSSSSLLTTSNMFLYCWEFNQPLSITNMDSVTDMGGMFNSCKAFNQKPILGNQTPDGSGNVWQINVPSVTTMVATFMSCLVFNNGDGINPLRIRTTSSLTNLSFVFQSCAKFNQAVIIQDITKVTTMATAFSGCNLFNNGGEPLNLSSSSSLLTTSNMFLNCWEFNQPISITNMDGVTNMSNMFSICKVFNKKPLLGDQTPDGSGTVWQINVPSVTTMASVFSESLVFNNGETTNTGINPLRIRTTSSLTNLASVFSKCAKFNQAVTIQNITKVTTMETAFSGCYVFNNGGLPLNLSSSSSLLTTLYMFSDCVAFNQPISISNMDGVTNMYYMFSNCRVFNQKPLLGVQTPDGSGIVWQINVPSVTTMLSAFATCLVFNNGETTNTGISPLRIRTTSSLTNLSSVFQNSAKFNQAVTIQNITKVSIISNIFSGCSLFNNGYGSGDTSNLLFPVKPSVTINTTGFGNGSLLSNGNKPSWLSATWAVI